MARTNLPAVSRNDGNPEFSELMAPFLGSAEVEGLLTPYRVAVLVILEQYITFDNPYDFSPSEKRRIALGFLRLFRYTHRPFENLKRIVWEEFESEVMRNVFQIFTKRIKDMDLDLFMSMLYGCIATVIYGDGKHCVKSASYAGHFARRLFVCYKKASFSDICRLWLEFRQYFQCDDIPISSGIDSNFMASSGAVQSLSTTVEELSFANGDAAGNKTAPGGGNRRTNGSEDGVIPDRKGTLSFILKQIRLFAYDPLSALSYSAIAQWITRSRRYLPNLHELDYLEHLNEQRIKNFPAAESALHRYIDRAGLELMNRNVFDAMVSNNRLTGQANTFVPTTAFRALRYGPLLLADMNRRFGNKEKALAYLQECIRDAEEANDKVCLDYAVVLVCMLDSEDGRNDFQRLIQQSLRATEDRNVVALHFRCHLVQLFKHIIDCDHARSITDVKHIIFHELCEKSASISNAGGSFSLEQSIRNITCVALSSAYLQRGYWNSACLEARKIVQSTCEKTSNVRSIAVANLAYGLAAKGRYNEGRKIISDSKKYFPTFTAEWERINLADAIIAFEAAFLIGDDDECKRNLQRIAAVSSAEARIREAFYLGARNTYGEAIQSMRQFLSEDKKSYLKCRALLVLCDIFLHRIGKIGLAHEFFTKCQKLADESRLVHVSTMASYGLLEAKAALGVSIDSNLVCGIGSMTEETSSLTALQAACVALSKARLMLKLTSDGDEKGLFKTVDILEKVLPKMEVMNAHIYERQTYALLAIAHDRLGDTEKRNLASNKYRQLNEQLRKCGFTALIF